MHIHTQTQPRKHTNTERNPFVQVFLCRSRGGGPLYSFRITIDTKGVPQAGNMHYNMHLQMCRFVSQDSPR